MERKLEVGSSIVYVDQHAKAHNALVTVVWGDIPSYQSPTGQPGCNVVFVSGDASKADQYGTQIERETSVVHMTLQPAHGRYWRWADEVKK